MENLILYETQTINKTYNNEQIKISCPEDIFKLKQLEEIKNKVQEHLLVISLNNKNIVNSIELVGIGSSQCINISGTDVLRCAILRGSTGIILVHNHPSGENKPSNVDIAFTNSLMNMATPFNIKILDHIIVGNECLSMKKEEFMNENHNSSFFESEAIKELKEQNKQLLNKLEKLKNKIRKNIHNSEIEIPQEELEV